MALSFDCPKVPDPNPQTKHDLKAGLALAGIVAMGACAHFATQIHPGGDASGSSDVSIGDTQYMGARNCDKAIKQQLSDPDSFQRISTQIVDVKPGSGWVAQTTFRARNGLGGYAEAAADCLFDGNSYRALLR